MRDLNGARLAPDRAATLARVDWPAGLAIIAAALIWLLCPAVLP